MMMQQEQDGKAVTHRPTRRASQGWKNGKLQFGLWKSTRAVWIVEVYQSIHRRWVKTTGKVFRLLNSRGTCM